MIKTLVPYILIAAAMTLVSATAAAAFDRLDHFRDDVRYDVTAERVFVGTVDGKLQVREDVVYVSLLTDDARIEVQIGPKEFFKRSGFRLSVGEMVTVVGMPAVIRNEEVVLAREVSTPDSILVVRDHEGKPMWETGGPVLMDPERRNEPFMVCWPVSPV